MQWDDLRFVLAVGRHRTLAAAGRAVGVDPTTVGRRIVALEGALATRLFHRTADGFVPTEAGSIAVARAAGIEATALALGRELEGRDGRVEGPVRITALDAFHDRFLIPRLPRLLDAHPGLEPTLSSELQLVDLGRREADIAIRGSRPDHPDHVGRELGRQALAVYVARDARFAGEPPVIGLPRSLDGTGMAGTHARTFPGARIAARAVAEAHVHGLVRAGLGIGLIDCFAGDTDPALRRHHPDPVAAYPMWAVVHVDLARVPRVRAVVDFLSAIFREDADLLEGRRPLP